MHITWHLISGCTVGLELVDGSIINESSTDIFIVLDLFLVRAVISFR
jgi:hypothetical protein